MLDVLFLTFIIITTSDQADQHQRCYGDLGCFSTLIGLPALPQSPDHIQTNFLLFTRASRTHATHVVARDPSTWHNSLGQGHFSSHRDTKLIIHGFVDHGNKEWVKRMKDELLKKVRLEVYISDGNDGCGGRYGVGNSGDGNVYGDVGSDKSIDDDDDDEEDGDGGLV